MRKIKKVEMGLQILLRNRYFSEQPVILPQGFTNHRKIQTLGVIIFGSDHARTVYAVNLTSRLHPTLSTKNHRRQKILLLHQ